MQRKGISPLVATVLLIAFTISVGAIIGAWVTGFSKGKSEELNKVGTNTVECAGAGIKFDKSELGTTSVVVTNVGNIDLDSLKITVQGALGSSPSGIIITQSLAEGVNSTNPLRPGDKRVVSNFSLSSGDMITITSTKCPSVFYSLTK